MPHGAIRYGALHWLKADGPDGAVQDYAHPYLVIQDDLFNSSRIHTVVVCALTTNLGRITEPGNVMLDLGEGGLPKQSVVVVSQLLSVDKDRLGERIGMLSAERVEQVLAGIVAPRSPSHGWESCAGTPASHLEAWLRLTRSACRPSHSPRNGPRASPCSC